MLSELEELWGSLAVPPVASDVRGKRIPAVPHESPAYLAVDGQGRRHLLVIVPEDTQSLRRRETRGLRVTTDRFRIGDRPEALCIDLVCLDEAQHPTFTAVAEDLVRSLSRSPTRPREVVVGALKRWAAFWSARVGGLSKEEALGLFGELWFLHRWLRAGSAEVVSRWLATPDARHDFQWADVSVEAKTAATTASTGPVHRISGLDQLDDPVTGHLYLFSLQVTDDALAANTLVSMVETLEQTLRGDEEALVLFNEKLAGRGYSPADADLYQRRLRVIAERLYVVGEGFPRLTRGSFPAGLPDGVNDVTYTLATAACAPWLVAAAPGDESALFLR